MPDDVETTSKLLMAARFHLKYQPALDGLRGVAIGIVLLVHGGVLNDDCAFAFVGVNTFFVLSGFLITALLVEEWDATKHIALGRFYLRRALRLLPALVAMLCAFLVFAFWMDPHKRAIREANEALRALFYFSNWARIYHLGRNVSLAHTWSLSIEEQFYLLWPLALLFGLRRTTRPSLLCWIILGICLSVVTRIGLHIVDRENIAGNILPPNPDRIVLGLDSRADSLLCGCLVGVIVSSNLIPQTKWFPGVVKVLALVAAGGLVYLGTFWALAPGMIYCGWLLASVLAMIIVLFIVSDSGGLLRQALTAPPLVFVGKVSYGLYVWHFPILIALREHHRPWENMIYLVWVVPVTLASYYLIERPCLKWKRHFVANKGLVGASTEGN